MNNDKIVSWENIGKVAMPKQTYVDLTGSEGQGLLGSGSDVNWTVQNNTRPVRTMPW